MALHVPVMTEQVCEFLHIKKNAHYIDCTVGGAGHSEEILKRNRPRGRLIGFEWDANACRAARTRLARYGARALLINASFAKIIDEYRKATPRLRISGILYDFGLSTDQLKSSGRGFSFLGDEPLDMRFSIDHEMTAASVLNTWKEAELADIIYRYGEERFSRRIAAAVVSERKRKRFTHTSQLVSLIERVVPSSYRHGRIHCATRTFQALRITVNDELAQISASLVQAKEILSKFGGRLVVISFHSLEDRIAKHIMKAWQRERRAAILTKKPVCPSGDEIERNPASRSAKLRACEILKQ